MNSRQKGARGERELAAFLRGHGWESRRGQQYAGDPSAPDVVSEFPLHIECKRTERLSLYDALDQAARDADGPSAVFHRRNRHRWVVVIDADLFMEISREWAISQTER